MFALYSSLSQFCVIFGFCSFLGFSLNHIWVYIYILDIILYYFISKFFYSILKFKSVPAVTEIQVGGLGTAGSDWNSSWRTGHCGQWLKFKLADRARRAGTNYTLKIWVGSSGRRLEKSCLVSRLGCPGAAVGTLSELAASDWSHVCDRSYVP